MKPNEINIALRIKGLEWESAIEAGKTYHELLQIYKEIKELQYRLVKAQIEEKETGHGSPV